MTNKDIIDQIPKIAVAFSQYQFAIKNTLVAERHLKTAKLAFEFVAGDSPELAGILSETIKSVNTALNQLNGPEAAQTAQVEAPEAEKFLRAHQEEIAQGYQKLKDFLLADELHDMPESAFFS